MLNDSSIHSLPQASNPLHPMQSNDETCSSFSWYLGGVVVGSLAIGCTVSYIAYVAGLTTTIGLSALSLGSIAAVICLVSGVSLLYWKFSTTAPTQNNASHDNLTPSRTTARAALSIIASTPTTPPAAASDKTTSSFAIDIRGNLNSGVTLSDSKMAHATEDQRKNSLMEAQRSDLIALRSAILSPREITYATFDYEWRGQEYIDACFKYLSRYSFSPEAIRNVFKALNNNKYDIANLLSTVHVRDPSDPKNIHIKIHAELHQENPDLYYQVMSIAFSAHFGTGLPDDLFDSTPEGNVKFDKLMDAVEMLACEQIVQTNKHSSSALTIEQFTKALVSLDSNKALNEVLGSYEVIDNVNESKAFRRIEDIITQLLKKYWTIKFTDLIQESNRDFGNEDHIKKVREVVIHLFQVVSQVWPEKDVASLFANSFTIYGEYSEYRYGRLVGGEGFRNEADKKQFFSDIRTAMDDMEKMLGEAFHPSKHRQILHELNNEIKDNYRTNLFFSIYTFKAKLWETGLSKEAQSKTVVALDDSSIKEERNFTFGSAVSRIPIQYCMLGYFLQEFADRNLIGPALDSFDRQELLKGKPVSEIHKDQRLRSAYMAFTPENREEFFPNCSAVKKGGEYWVVLNKVQVEEITEKEVTDLALIPATTSAATPESIL